MIKSLSHHLILFICPLFFLVFSTSVHAEDNFARTNVFVTVGAGGGLSSFDVWMLSNIGSDLSSQVCYDAEVGVIFLKYLGVVGGYAGCIGDSISVNRGRLMLLLQKKMDVDSWGFRPYIAAGANYSVYNYPSDLSVAEAPGNTLSGFGFSTELGLKFHYRMFLIGINLNVDTAFKNQAIRESRLILSKTGVTVSGGMKVGVLF